MIVAFLLRTFLVKMLVKTLALTWCLLALTGPHICVASKSSVELTQDENHYENPSNFDLYANLSTHTHEKNINDIFEHNKVSTHLHPTNKNLLFKTEVGRRVWSSLIEYQNTSVNYPTGSKNAQTPQAKSIYNVSQDRIVTDENGSEIHTHHGRNQSHFNSSNVRTHVIDKTDELADVPKLENTSTAENENENSNITTNVLISSEVDLEFKTTVKNSSADAGSDKVLQKKDKPVAPDLPRGNLCNLTHPGQTERLDMQFTSTIVDNGMFCFLFRR